MRSYLEPQNPQNQRVDRILWFFEHEMSFNHFIRSLKNDQLGGGFKNLLFSPLLGEDVQFDDHIFQMGGSTTN